MIRNSLLVPAWDVYSFILFIGADGRHGARYTNPILEKDGHNMKCLTAEWLHIGWSLRRNQRDTIMRRFESLFHLDSSRDRIHKKRTVVPSFTDNQELSELLKSYKINKIHTTKYSFLSFVPKNLFEQLHRIANIYFILIAALNFVPVVEAFQAEVALVPILFVLTATALKDIWEDYRRFKSDFSINRLPCHVFDR